MDEVLKEIRSIGLSISYYEQQLQKNAKFLENYGERIKEKYLHSIAVENDFYQNKLIELEREGKKVLKEWDVWNEWLQHVKGVGVNLTLKILGYLDFDKAKHISSFWKFCGFTADSNKKQDYNHTVKGYLVRQGMSFLGILGTGIKPFHYSEKFQPRVNGKYAKFFLKHRKLADEKYPNWTKPHKFYHAMRVMIKKYLADLFVVYHWFRNNKAVVTYAVQHLGKDYQYLPFIDKVQEPEWLLRLRAEYESMGVKALTI